MSFGIWPPNGGGGSGLDRVDAIIDAGTVIAQFPAGWITNVTNPNVGEYTITMVPPYFDAVLEWAGQVTSLGGPGNATFSVQPGTPNEIQVFGRDPDNPGTPLNGTFYLNVWPIDPS